MLLALCCGQNTPARWVVWHRLHHQHADEENDPHSPLVAFFWSHIGWLLYDKNGTHKVEAYYKYARDFWMILFTCTWRSRGWPGLLFTYNKMCGKRIRVRRCKPAADADALIEKAVKRFCKSGLSPG